MSVRAFPLIAVVDNLAATTPSYITLAIWIEATSRIAIYIGVNVDATFKTNRITLNIAAD